MKVQPIFELYTESNLTVHLYLFGEIVLSKTIRPKICIIL